jgi:CheY-like chemotaxis protein
MGEKKKILIVDDSQLYVDLVVGAMGEQYDITSVPSAETGLKALAALTPDLILLDIRMPGMGGVEFIRQLARKTETRAIPIIVVTAYDYNSITESLLKNEPAVRFFLTKLSPVDVVIEKVAEVLGKGVK